MSNTSIAILLLGGTLGMTSVGVAIERRATTEYTDLGANAANGTATFDATAPVLSKATVKKFRIPVTHETIEIADGVKYEGWTFGGTVPGPALRVRQGDLVQVVLVNESNTPHSIDFHSARIPMDEAMKTIMPGDSVQFEFLARDTGAYMVHCGTPPVLMHIMQGMYLAIIVDPVRGWGTQADKEFVIVQSEFYAKSDDAGRVRPDWEAARDKRASYVVFNGRAFQYKSAPLQANLGDRVRFFVVNAGPSERSDFHVVGTVFDRVYPDGNPKNVLNSIQTWSVAAGGGAVFEAVFEEGASGEGTYAFVTHAFADADKGAVGLIKVGNAQGHVTH